MATIDGTPTALANFGRSIPGVKTSFDIPDTPNSIERAQLPCFIVVPETGEMQGFSAKAMMGKAPQVHWTLLHILFFELSDVVDFRKALPVGMKFLQAYFVALAANPFLTGATAPAYHNNPEVTATVAILEFAGKKYHGIEFKHKMYINL